MTEAERLAMEGTANASKNGEKEESPAAEGNAQVLYGRQPIQEAQAQEQPMQEEESFDSLIAGKYKKDYERAIQRALSKRLKGKSEAEKAMEQLRPFLEMQAQRAGVDVNDTEAVIRSMAENSDFLDQYAEEHGYSKEEAVRVFGIESEHRRMVREAHEREAQEQYAQVLAQARQAQQNYPAFDLDEEMNDKKFATMVASGIPVEAAYIACHPEVVQQKAMSAADEAARQTVHAVAANLNRPVENGMSGQSSVIVKDDPSKYTKRDREEIRRRVERGEKIFL